MGLGALFSPSRQLTIVTDHTMNIVGQLMLISNVFNTACMDFVSDTFFRSKMAIEFELTLIFPMLHCKIIKLKSRFISSFGLSPISKYLHYFMLTINRKPCLNQLQVWILIYHMKDNMLIVFLFRDSKKLFFLIYL